MNQILKSANKLAKQVNCTLKDNLYSSKVWQAECSPINAVFCLSKLLEQILYNMENKEP